MRLRGSHRRAFVLGNLASLIAFYKFLSGERYVRWEPIRASAEQGVQSS